MIDNIKEDIEKNTMKLIVGLGNPEEKYVNTRHNIGHMSIDRYARNNNLLDKGKEEYKGYLYYSDSKDIILVKPYTGMNSSGDCIKEIVDRYSIDISNILIILDDISLSFGKLRLREKGSDGRHKGIKSIIDTLGSNEINRLRVGIDKPKDNSIILYDYVLSDFNDNEKILLPDILDNICKAIDIWIDIGCQKAMNSINK